MCVEASRNGHKYELYLPNIACFQAEPVRTTSLSRRPSVGEMKGKGNSSRYRIHRDGEREGEKEDNLLYFSPSSAPSFAFGQVMQITLLNKKSKHAGPPSTPTSTSSSSSISRYIFPLLLLPSSLLPLCRWRLSISRQDCICRLVASPPSLHSMHKAAGKAPGRQRERGKGGAQVSQ